MIESSKILKEVISLIARQVSTIPTQEKVEENKLEIANCLVLSSKVLDSNLFTIGQSKNFSLTIRGCKKCSDQFAGRLLPGYKNKDLRDFWFRFEGNSTWREAIYPSRGPSDSTQTMESPPGRRQGSLWLDFKKRVSLSFRYAGRRIPKTFAR